jgi:hypothetical protein
LPSARLAAMMGHMTDAAVPKRANNRPRSARAQVHRCLNLWSRRGFDALDQRLVEARAERQIIADLTHHVGGQPSAPQRMLIRRAARLAILVGILEKRAIEGGQMGDLAGRQLCAFSNSLRLVLVSIGLDRPEKVPTRLADVIKVA